MQYDGGGRNHNGKYGYRDWPPIRSVPFAYRNHIVVVMPLHYKPPQLLVPINRTILLMVPNHGSRMHSKREYSSFLPISIHLNWVIRELLRFLLMQQIYRPMKMVLVVKLSLASQKTNWDYVHRRLVR